MEAGGSEMMIGKDVRLESGSTGQSGAGEILRLVLPATGPDVRFGSPAKMNRPPPCPVGC